MGRQMFKVGLYCCRRLLWVFFFFFPFYVIVLSHLCSGHTGHCLRVDNTNTPANDPWGERDPWLLRKKFQCSVQDREREREREERREGREGGAATTACFEALPTTSMTTTMTIAPAVTTITHSVCTCLRCTTLCSAPSFLPSRKGGLQTRRWMRGYMYIEPLT